MCDFMLISTYYLSLTRLMRRAKVTYGYTSMHMGLDKVKQLLVEHNMKLRWSLSHWIVTVQWENSRDIKNMGFKRFSALYLSLLGVTAP